MAMSQQTFILDELAAVIAARAEALQQSDMAAQQSYTASLLREGRGKIVRKFGEEALEVVLAATLEADTPQAQSLDIIAESADLLYHLLVLWQDAGISPDMVWQELASRHGVSGLVEKAGRTSS